MGIARRRAGGCGGRGAAGRAGRRTAAGLARPLSRCVGPATSGHRRRPGRRHRRERRLARGAGHHTGGHDPAGGRRRVGRAGRPARHRTAPAGGHPQDAPPRLSLQLARLPIGGRAKGGAGQRGGGQHLPAAERASPHRAGAHGDGRAPHRHRRGRGRHRHPAGGGRTHRAAGRHPRRPDARPQTAASGPRTGSYRRRDSNPHCRPPKDRVSCQLDYAGNAARIRTPTAFRRRGPCAASPRGRWRARCTAPPPPSRPGRSRTSSGSRRSPSCRTSASRRRHPRR